MMEFFRMLSNDSLALLGLNVLLQVTVFSALALLASRLFANNAALKWWTLGAALSLILLSPGLALLAQKIEPGLLALENSPAPELAESNSSALFPVAQIAEQQGADAKAIVPVYMDSADADAAAIRQAPDSLPSSATRQASSTFSLAEIVVGGFRMLLLVWAVGACWMLIRMARSWQMLCAIRNRSQEVSDEGVCRVFYSACQQLSVSRIPEFQQSSEVSSPVAAGVFRPVVLIPKTLADSLTTDQIKDVLLHEVAHVARRDQIIVIAQNLALCLFWLHPLVRMVNRQFAQAREEICDNHVLRSTNAPAYSRTLLELAERTRTPASMSTAVGMLDDWSLESRVASLLSRGRNRMTDLTARHAAVVSLLFGILLFVGVIATVKVSTTEVNDEVERPLGVPADLPVDRKDKAEAAPKKESEFAEPIDTTGANAGEPLAASAKLHFSGKVVDPQDRPVKGAKVYFARYGALPLATTDDDGRFEFPYTKARLPNNAAWGNIRLVAVAEGFGIAISPALRFEDTGKGRKDLIARNPNKKFDGKTPPPVLKLAEDDVPIQGRIVDLEGQPLSDISVQLRFVNKAYARFAFDAVTTNADGRFEINGIGRDRIVRLVAKGDRTEFSVFFAKTLNVAAVTRTIAGGSDPFDLERSNQEIHQVTYGAKLTHAIGPSVPVEGLITDERTGKPLRDVTVSVYQLSNKSETPAREELNAVTDTNGRYRLAGLPLGSNVIRATTRKDAGYLTRRATVKVSDDVRLIEKNLKLTKGVLLTGHVTDSETGDPILGTVTYAAHENNKYFKPGALQSTTKTDKNGRYEISVFPGNGYITFRARNREYLIAAMSDDVRAALGMGSPFIRAKPVALMPTSYSRIQSINPKPDNAAATSDLILTKEPTVTVRILDPDGMPLTAANVEEALVMPIGGFAIGANQIVLPGNTYRVQQFSPSSLTSLTVRHEKRGLIGHLRISDSSFPELPRIIKRDGKVTKDPGRDPYAARIDGDDELTLTMRRGAKVTGRVVDKDGNPRVVRITGYGRLFKTDDDGRFELSLVLPEFPLSLRAIHREQGQFLGSIVSDVMLNEGELRDLGDLQITAP